MANSDTLVKLTGPGTGRYQINALTLAATTETVFVMGTDTSGTTVPAVLSIPGTSTTLLVGSGSPAEFNLSPAISTGGAGRKVQVGTAPPFYSATTFDAGRPFKIRVCGTATLNAGTGNTAAIAIYLGTSATTASDVKIAALTAGGAPSTSGNFNLEATVSWDVTTGKVGGWFLGHSGNTLTAPTALSNAATAATASALSFVVSGTFGAAGGGTLNVSEFSIEQL